MISNRDIIIINDDWGRFPSTLQHIAKVLMENRNRVYWIGSLGLRKPKLNLSDIRRAFVKIKNVIINTGNEKNVYGSSPVLINPFVLPFHDLKLIRSINKFFIVRKIKKLVSEYKAHDPILITSSPITDFLIGELNESSSFYYCVDDYSKMEGAFTSIPTLEKKLIEKVDGTFAVSDYLYQTRKSNKKNIFLVSQGVEIEHFKISDNIANEVKNLNKPVIGFFGLVSEWINLELIYKCVLKYPEYTFLIIGKSVRNLSRLNDCKNFVYLGSKEYGDLLNYASIFDVGLIPFELNEITIAANPLKLLEYFSMGIPVVSTNLPEVKKFGDLVSVAENDEQFINFIKIAVEDNNAKRNRRRIQEAKKYSWNSITEKVFNTVLEIESGKSLKINSKIN